MSSEKAILLAGAGSASVLGSAGPGAEENSRVFGLTGSGTSKSCFRSNLRDSRLSAIILAYSRSKSASSSGSTASSCRVTTMASSSDSLSPSESSSASCYANVSSMISPQGRVILPPHLLPRTHFRNPLHRRARCHRHRDSRRRTMAH